MNTWPNGRRRALHQDAHEQWNQTHYPGTRQLCVKCEEPTGRCREDELTVDSIDGPLCERCYRLTSEYAAENHPGWFRCPQCDELKLDDTDGPYEGVCEQCFDDNQDEIEQPEAL